MKTNRRTIKPDMQKIGAGFKARRKDQKISQAVVGQWLGISQRLVSYFEKGRARLSEQQLVSLDKHLSTANRVGIVTSKPLDLLSAENFLKVQAEVTNTDVADIWLFGPEKLSVFAQPGLAENWIAHVGVGANLRVVWRLDVNMESHAVGLFSSVAAKIICNLKQSATKSMGSIEVYAITGGNKGYKGNNEPYCDMQEHFRDEFFGNHVKVHDAVEICNEKFAHLHPLLDIGRFGPVLAYIGKSMHRGVPDSPIAAGLLIEHISLRPGTLADTSFESVLRVAESGWVFMSSEAEHDLQYRCNELLKVLVSEK